MYLSPNARVADVTYGKGVFWKKVQLDEYEFFPSDILTCPTAAYDFRNLPYDDATFDCVVLDPPYCHNPGRMIGDANYKNVETTRGMYHKDIMHLYRDGMAEAYRVLRIGGMLWVKCKDEIESSYQRWSHIEIYGNALDLGYFAKDLFVLTQLSKPTIQHKKQQHARKNHSYLFVFKKPNTREERELLRFGIWKEKR
jgi:hypothetical protein